MLTKKLLHLTYFLNKQTNIKLVLNFDLLYISSKKQLLNNYAFLTFFIFFKKQFIISCCYNIKFLTVNVIIFNSILIFFFNILKNLNIYTLVKSNIIKKKKKKYTIIRSPFVYKKAREQYALDRFTSIISIEFSKSNLFLIKY
jgi:hypothetical protein